MAVEFGELQDWEVLSDSNSDEEIKGFEGIKEEIRSDYFSVDSGSKYSRSVGDVVEESSGNWVGDGLVIGSPEKVLGEICLDSGSFGLGDGVIEEFVGKSEVGFVENGEIEVGFVGNGDIEVGFDGIGEIVVRELGEKNQVDLVGIADEGDNSKNLGLEEKIEMSSDGGSLKIGDVCENGEIEVGLDRTEEIFVRKLSENSPVNLVGNEDESENLTKFGLEEKIEMSNDGGSSELGDACGNGGGGGGGDKQSGDKDIVNGEMKSGGEGEKRVMVWWKLLKYYALRIGPVWTVSMAAAVMGFVILGRRYYSMKRKSRSMQVKVTMDDKKISQFKSRVVRLNEAFSVVKHVPVIRASLPAAGVTPWL